MNTAYLATHIAYIPTGYGRHPIYIADAPELYHFLRQNLLCGDGNGELDMVAEFADLFRQYGCHRTKRCTVARRDPVLTDALFTRPEIAGSPTRSRTRRPR